MKDTELKPAILHEEYVKGRRDPKTDKQYLRYYDEQYIVDYSYTDENGFWGQRSQMIFSAKNKDCFDEVRSEFCEILKKTPNIKYEIHSVGLA